MGLRRLGPRRPWPAALSDSAQRGGGRLPCTAHAVWGPPPAPASLLPWPAAPAGLSPLAPTRVLLEVVTQEGCGSPMGLGAFLTTRFQTVEGSGVQGPCAPPLPWATAGPHSSSATRVPLQPPSAPRAPRGSGEGSKTLAGTRHPHPLPGSLGNKWRVQGGCSRPFLLPLSLGLGGGGPAAPRGGGVVGTRAPLLSHLVCNTLVSGAHVLGARGVPTLYKLCRRGWSRKDSRKEEWEGHPARLMWAIPSAWEQDPRPQRKGVWPEQGGGRREGPALVRPGTGLPRCSDSCRSSRAGWPPRAALAWHPSA